MIPKSLSATAIQTAEACPARFKAENLERSKGFGGIAANVGSTVHGALELFVKACYLDKTEESSWELLVTFLKLSYVQVFGTHDTESIEYLDAYEMLQRWFARNQDLHELHRIVSVEVKEHFLLPTSAGPIQFNYIWDRFDEIKPGVFRVVDYKSNRWGLSPDDLQKKIQARVYGLACAIKLKQEGIPYERIWVQFDLLRHSPVGRVFTRADNEATWHFLVATAESIIARGEDEFEERLNPECLFCVRKASCSELKKNLNVGGILSLTPQQKVDALAQVSWQMSGLRALETELKKQIMTEAKALDVERIETDTVVAEFGRSKQRAVDAEMVALCIGDKLFEKYGQAGITMANIDKLLKGTELDAEKKKQLKSLIYDKIGNPTVNVKPKNPIDED